MGSKGTRAASPPEQEGPGHDHRGGDDGVVDITQVVARGMPARADRPPDPRDDRGEHEAADRGERDESPERPFEDPGGQRHERAYERRREAEGDGDGAEPIEPAFR